MLNGEIGAFAYLDDSYDGNGNPTEQLSNLDSGTGDLTDGVIPDQRWNQLPTAYVGWRTVNPVIRFEFDEPMEFERVDFYFDDTVGQGQVHAPREIHLTDGVRSTEVPVTGNETPGQLLITIENTDLSGDFLEATIMRGAAWMMLSEVVFNAEVVPEPTTSTGLCLALPILFSRLRRSRR